MLFVAFASCRYLSYSASFLLFGASVMLALSGSHSLSLAAQTAFRTPLRIAAALGAIATLCLLPLQTATIADEWLAMMDPDMLITVAVQTRYGQAWCLRMLTAILVLCVFLRARPGQARLRAMVAGVALLPLSLSGHAAMEEGWTELAHTASDFVHCLAAGFWLGSLPVFLYFLKTWQEPTQRQKAAGALIRFSTAGHIAVAALLLSGVANAVMILQPVGLDPASSYQRLLLVKIVLALAMVCLALINRYRWIPRIRKTGELALRHIRRNTLVELATGAAILLLVSFLGLMPP